MCNGEEKDEIFPKFAELDFLKKANYNSNTLVHVTMCNSQNLGIFFLFFFFLFFLAEL